MQAKTYTNIDFLDNYFTSKEFDFINRVNSEKQKLDQMVTKETETRDIIVTFINNLDNAIPNNNGQKSNENFLQLLSEVKDIFEKINSNIKMINELQLEYSKVSDAIVELLIKIESNLDNQDAYTTPIQELKDMINEFAIQNRDIESKVLLNDIKINTFLQKNIVKKYLSSFDIEIPVNDLSKNVEKQPENSRTRDFDNLNQNVSNNDNVKNEYSIENLQENNTLVVSEKLNKVFLPYTKSEVTLYLEQYPDEYKSFNDVIRKEFVLPLDYYMRHPVLARFREAYSLIRDRESKSVVDAFKFAIDIMFHHELNPVVIAACKTQEQLNNYMVCSEKGKLDEFTDFKIKFEVNPLV